MQQLVVGDDVCFMIRANPSGLEVVNPGGQSLGFIVAPETYCNMVDAWRRLQGDDLAELDERASRNEVGTLDEAWRMPREELTVGAE